MRLILSFNFACTLPLLALFEGIWFAAWRCTFLDLRVRKDFRTMQLLAPLLLAALNGKPVLGLCATALSLYGILPKGGVAAARF
jgi:hypothetical protein